jgi:hypothetical protein
MTTAVTLIALGLCFVAAVVLYGGAWLDDD